MTITEENPSNTSYHQPSKYFPIPTHIGKIVQDRVVLENHNQAEPEFSGQRTALNLHFPMTGNQTPTAVEEKEYLPRRTERILFVDDDEMLASLGEQLLTASGYQIVAMTDSIEALKLFSTNSERFDLIITDQTMPELTGKDMIQELKKIRADIPTILCTGFSNKIDEELAKQLGIDAFMMKPIDLPNLLQTIRRVLEKKKIFNKQTS
jgi:CheY-like chemotaxis protein